MARRGLGATMPPWWIGPTDLEAMTAARRGRLVLLARVIAGFTVVGVAAGLWLSTIDQQPTDLGLVLAFGLFPIVGYFMATRRPDNSLSWLMQGIGVAIGIGAFLGSYAGYAFHGGIGGREARADRGVAEQPDVGAGRRPARDVPSPAVPGRSPAVTPMAVVRAHPLPELGDHDFDDHLEPREVRCRRPACSRTIRNPLGVQALRAVLAVALASVAMLPIGVIGSLVALVRRFRRSEGIERLQLRWLVTAAAIVAVLYTLALLIGFAGAWGASAQPVWMTILQNISVFSFGLIPIAIGVSVLRYHLFDIDVVINRALLFGALAVFITVVYVAIVVGVGAIVGSRADPILSAAAAAVVALAFQPARGRPSGSPTGSCTASAPPRTRCSRSSPNGSATRTRTRSSCRGWRARWPAAPAPCGPTCGSASGTSSSRRAGGRRTPRRCRRSRRPTTTKATCRRPRCASRSGIKASCWARCRS